MNQGQHFANNSLFIGDLSKFCTEANLESLFSAYGHIVDVKIKRNNTTGKTLSYGFVTFSNDESAAAAMEHLNGFSFFGRNLRIRWAVHNAKAQKPPEESVINSVYVRFITPKITEYVTEEDFHHVFDQFGSILDVSIKESAIDQRANRQSGYGFVHFTADNAGIAAAFQAVSAIDNATIEGVTYNVELSKNLLKQFNEMKRTGEMPGGMPQPTTPGGMQGHGMTHHRGASDGSMSSLGSHSSHGTAGVPMQNVPYGVSPQAGRWAANSPYPDGPRGYGMAMPAPAPGAAPYPHAMGHAQQGMYPRPGPGPNHPRAAGGYMGQQMAPAGMQGYGAQPMPYGGAYHNPYGTVPPTEYGPNVGAHQMGQMQGPYGQYHMGGPAFGQQHTAGMPAPLQIQTQHLPQPQESSSQQQPLSQEGPRSVGSNGGSPRYAQPGPERPTSALSGILGEGRSPTSLAGAGLSGGSSATSPKGTAASSAHSLTVSIDHTTDPLGMFPRSHSRSPLPNRSPHGVHPAATAAPTSVVSQSHSHSGYARSLTESLDEESLFGPSAHSIPGGYSPFREASPANDTSGFESGSDCGLSIGMVNKPPPLNLHGLGMHTSGGSAHASYNNSSANSVSGGSVHGGSVYGSSASTSPMPTVRGGLSERLMAGKLQGAQSQYVAWEHDAGPLVSRPEGSNKPPTPANRAVGSATQAGPPRGHALSYSSGSTSHESTPTNSQGKMHSTIIAGGVTVSPRNISALTHNLHVSTQGMPPQPLAITSPASARPGLQSRSSSNSSVSASTGVFSNPGNMSPPPPHHHTITSGSGGSGPNSALSTARRPGGLSDLDIPLNRSLSSSTSDRNIMNTLTGTTDTDGGFFPSSNSSFVDGTSRKESNSLSPFEHADLHANSFDNNMAAMQQLSLGDSLGLPLGQAYLRALDAKHETKATASQPLPLGSSAKQLSLQSVSTAPDEDHDNYGDDLTYSMANSVSNSPLKQLHSIGSSGTSFGLSSEGSFHMDTSFMLSPQTSASDESPFASQSFDSFRGKPPAGAALQPSALTASNLQGKNNLLVAAMLRRSITSEDDGENTSEGKPRTEVGRPLSISSTESSALAGIAIDSSSSSDASQHHLAGLAAAQHERGVRPESMRLKRSSGVFVATGCAVDDPAAVAPAGSCTTDADGSPEKAGAAEGEAKPKQRQLSLMQFFKPSAGTGTTATGAK